MGTRDQGDAEMTRISSGSTRRSAFTLVELLIVIAIIALLVSLSAAAVMRVMGFIPEVETRTEISQLDAALASFMADYNLDVPPPSVLVLREEMWMPPYPPPATQLE